MFRSRSGLLLSVGLFAAVLLLALAASAQAALPGQNGRIAYVAAPNGIWTMNPDGTGAVQVTTGGAYQPEWSPDGQRIAYVRSEVTCPCRLSEIHVINTDGSGDTLVFEAPTDHVTQPTWSPDAQRLAFSWRGEIWTIGVTGGGLTALTQTPESERQPVWSPDGTEIAFTVNARIDAIRPDGAGRRTIVFAPPQEEGVPTEVNSPDWSPDGNFLVYVLRHFCDGFAEGSLEIARADGTGSTTFRDTCYLIYVDPTWSPDGTRIAFWSHDTWEPFPIEHWRLDRDRSSRVMTGVIGEDIDWQPIPINAYPRPLAAGPVQVTMALAYQVCTSPNRTHGPPLDSRSCAPPAQSSGQLTVGTFDANARNPGGTGQVIANPLAGDPTTAADEADVYLRAKATDVRLASDLSDYTGALEARMTLRITDKDNTPGPGGPGAATVADVPHSFPVPCAPTPDPDMGSSCFVETTAEAFLPGIAKEKRRAIWELDQVALHDGAGNAFMRQGIFVP